MKKVMAVFILVAGLSGLCHASTLYGTNVPVVSVATDRTTGKTILTVATTDYPFTLCNSILQVVNPDQVSVLLTARSTGTPLRYISFTQLSTITVGPNSIGCQVEYVEL